MYCFNIADQNIWFDKNTARPYRAEQFKKLIRVHLLKTKLILPKVKEIAWTD